MIADRLLALSGQALAILLALAVGAGIVIAINESPLRVLATLLAGAFGSEERIAGTLLQTTPILLCGIAACISLRGGLFNIGIEGQLFMGGFAAAWVGFSVGLPPGLHLLVAIVLAVLAGMAWVAIPKRREFEGP